MDKLDEKVREAMMQNLMNIGAGFSLALAKIKDPSVAALTLSGVEGVVMSVENGMHVFRLDPGPHLEQLFKAAVRTDQTILLHEIQQSLQHSYHKAIDSLAMVQRTVEAAARLWRPVNIVVAGVRDEGGERR